VVKLVKLAIAIPRKQSILKSDTLMTGAIAVTTDLNITEVLEPVAVATATVLVVGSCYRSNQTRREVIGEVIG